MFTTAERLSEQISVVLNIKLLWKFYWWNRVHGESSDAQFRGVGWEFRLGVRPFKFIDVGYRHHSRHRLDESLPYRFPVEDSLYLRLYFKY
jgi:hypothetical protein